MKLKTAHKDIISITKKMRSMQSHFMDGGNFLIKATLYKWTCDVCGPLLGHLDESGSRVYQTITLPLFRTFLVRLV